MMRFTMRFILFALVLAPLCTLVQGDVRGVVSVKPNLESDGVSMQRGLKKKKKKSKKKKKEKSPHSSSESVSSSSESVPSSSETVSSSSVTKPSSKASKEVKKKGGPRPKRDKTVKKKESRGNADTSGVYSDKRQPRGTADSSCEIVNINNGVVASLSHDLCNEWIPGAGNSALCAATDTLNGGAVCSLASQCILQELQTMTNVGIVIAHSGIAQDDLRKGLLPYNQYRSVFPTNDAVFGFEIKGATLIAVLEEALEAAANGNDDSYPCGAGIRYSVDMNAAKGSRLSNLQVSVGVSDREWVELQPNDVYFVATTQSLLEGKYGYKSLGSVEDVIDLNVSFDGLFTSCAAVNCPFTSIQTSEYSTQEFSQ